MAKKYEDLSWSDKRRYLRDVSEDMGIDHRDYDTLGGGGRGKSGAIRSKSLEDLESDLADKFANDYDTRRAMEAASMSGAKGAGDLPVGISNMKEAYDVHKFLKKTHEKELDRGGAFSSANDYANVTKHFVEKDREEMLDTLATKDDLTAMKEKLMKKATRGKNSGEAHPAVPSERLAAAQERVHDSAHDPSSLYDKNNETAPRTDEQADAARTFLDDYKLDVTKGAALRQDIKTNVGNASNTVTNVYGR